MAALPPAGIIRPTCQPLAAGFIIGFIDSSVFLITNFLIFFPNRGTKHRIIETIHRPEWDKTQRSGTKHRGCRDKTQSSDNPPAHKGFNINTSQRLEKKNPRAILTKDDHPWVCWDVQYVFAQNGLVHNLDPRRSSTPRFAGIYE
jgi:hypothetical protein